jgi:hypothetical protein
LDVTWDDLRTTICRLRPILGRDHGMLRGLYVILRDPWFPGDPFPWPMLSRTLARRFISIVKGVLASYART